MKDQNQQVLAGLMVSVILKSENTKIREVDV